MAAKNIPEDQKNGLERRVSRFCTISDKTQLLNKNKIGKSYGNFSAQMGLNFQIGARILGGSKTLYGKNCSFYGRVLGTHF
jgi:hypothetical protein